MRYQSTRGNSPQQSFLEILLGGLAPDGGLYLPTQYPKVTAAQLDSWRSLSYALSYVRPIPSRSIAMVAPTIMQKTLRRYIG